MAVTDTLSCGVSAITVGRYDAEDIHMLCRVLHRTEADIVRALLDLAVGVAEMSERKLSEVVKEHMWWEEA